MLLSNFSIQRPVTTAAWKASVATPVVSTSTASARAQRIMRDSHARAVG